MGAEVDFNSIQFEKKLTGLKDSQDSINACCLWCLENRQHHKKIVSTWLNVLKRVRVEQRLTLFYLANDVIQYSKRKNYEFVESWGTALQKATTMVRDEKVKHKILRIFKIWEQRAVYGEEFITDLSGLISASPTTKKVDETHEFQSTYLINKIRNCAKLETETDHKLRMFKQHNPKLLDGEALVSSLKDRAHVDDVEKEMEDYVTHMEEYINALKMEIKSRNNLINMLLNAETQLEKDRKDVKEVALAYKLFATRVKNLKKKLDEKKSTLLSPIPSPDINAPSPSPDSDIDLPETNENTQETENFSFSNAGFYNPVSTGVPDTPNSFVNNGFSSFIGSGMNFNMQNINTSSLFSNDTTPNSNPVIETTHTTDSSYAPSNLANLFPSIIQPPPPPEPVPPVIAGNNFYNQQQLPLAPPPLPPFTKTDPYTSDGIYEYNNDQNSYDGNYNTQQTAPAVDPYQSYTPYENNSYTPAATNYETPAPVVVNNDASYSYDPYNPDEYNPEEEPETWDVEEQWDQPPQELDTPASPPPIEKEGFLEPIEYHDGPIGEGVDVDHRILEMLTKKADKKKDVDHRNLISLTGSPKSSSNTNDSWPNHRTDQDYRTPQKPPDVLPLEDRDYRLQFTTGPPPIPPILNNPPNNNNVSLQQQQSPKKEQDNTESIDMELSDDEEQANNKNIPVQHVEENGSLLPPPPFPDDANNFLDSLNESEFYDDQPSFDVYENLDLSAAKDENTSWNTSDDFLEDQPPPQPFMDDQWNMEPPPQQQQQPYHHNHHVQQHPQEFRGRGRGNRGGGFFRGRGGEFNNRGDFRGRGRRGGGKFGGRGGGWGEGWGETPPKRGKPRGGGWGGRPRGQRGFSPRGNFRNNY